MKIILAVITGPHAGRSFEFEEWDSFLVGRSEDSHLKFSYDDPYISRKHCLLRCSPPHIRVVDLGSRNGVMINGQRVLQSDLRHGDEIAIGHTKILVHIEGDNCDEMVTPDMPPTASFLSPLDVVSQTASAVKKPIIEVKVAQAPGALCEDYSRATFEGYELGPELGRGGMGVVYRARRLIDGLDVAIKQLVGTSHSPPKAMQRFLREANILASLQHPHIVRLLEAGSSNTGAFIAMELVVGPDMNQVVRSGGPLHITSATRLIRQVLAALAVAHRAGFVHRDVKPSNILLGQQADRKKLTKLADFGLARAYESSQVSGLTIQGEIGGTPLFMAPEQITHYRDVTPAADQYSAAATLYYLLTAKYPIEPSSDTSKTLVKVLTEEPVPLHERMPALPQALSSILAKALARDPNKRFRDVLEFRHVLKPFANISPS